MGLYDNIKCCVPLPLEGANDLTFQTKDTFNPFLDNYEIRADATLWREHYELEDHSDPTAEGIERIFGSCSRVNCHWEPELMTEELTCYTIAGLEKKTWIEFVALFVEGQLKSLRMTKPIEQIVFVKPSEKPLSR